MSWTTHEVTNQVPELGDYNLYASDTALQEGVIREGAQAHREPLLHYGARLGLKETFSLAHDANRFRPELETHDRQGHRVGRVRLHPAWHRFTRMAFLQGIHISVWSTPQSGAQVDRRAPYLMHEQAAAGFAYP